MGTDLVVEIAESSEVCRQLLIDVGGTPSYVITNAHGDIVGTTDPQGNFTASTPTDEFGVGTVATNRLGWLGAHQRYSTGGTLNLIRMGVRLYDPRLGRFLQVDPVEGGSCNDYDYVCGNPVNALDLDGKFMYSLHYDLGTSNLTPAQYMARVAANFGRVFPISGRSSVLPGKGGRMPLKRVVDLPVYVSRRSADGWTFGTRAGHPDWPGGWISFKFYKSQGRMKLRIRAYVPDYSPASLGTYFACGVACYSLRRRMYVGIVNPTWSRFAANLRSQGW